MTSRPETDNPRDNLDRLIRTNGDDYASMSRFLKKNPAYIQQYIKRGSPKKLDEVDRRKLADYYAVDEKLLGAVAGRSGQQQKAAEHGGLIPIPQLQIGASAGPGALAEDDGIAGSMGFGPEWLKQLNADPAKLSLIRVDGDSMDPTLCDGDDIMVDHGVADLPLRDGIYVLRLDDVLLVKRLAIRPGGRLSIRSDNNQYPDWEDVATTETSIIGRVIWAGRRL
ncbi:S24 family peptidase [Parasphingorhabdus sp.]|uniref:S24 family peptidase n=1 Tax=Parasphingorhabdus sp. TaxID=2709688 RepID=UPI0032654EF2